MFNLIIITNTIGSLFSVSFSVVFLALQNTLTQFNNRSLGTWLCNIKEQSKVKNKMLRVILQKSYCFQATAAFLFQVKGRKKTKHSPAFK